MNNYKFYLKKIIPIKLLKIFQNFKLKKNFKNKNIDFIFSEIYKEKLWGFDNKKKDFKFYSGLGSHDGELIQNYLDTVRKFLLSFNHKPNVVDLGCGDFNIGSKLREYCNTYIATDVVEELISYNIKKYQNMSVDFKVLDITKDNLPKAEICFLRQVLQHLSNESILKFIKLIENKYKFILITEHFPDKTNFVPNIDKSNGADIRIFNHSAVVLTKPPFNLKVVKEKIICKTTSNKIPNFEGFLQTTLLQL